MHFCIFTPQYVLPRAKENWKHSLNSLRTRKKLKGASNYAGAGGGTLIKQGRMLRCHWFGALEIQDLHIRNSNPYPIR